MLKQFLHYQVQIPHWIYWIYVVVAAVAAWTDYKTGKIYNWITFPSLILGFLLVGGLGGAPGLKHAFLGFSAASLIFLPLYVFRVFGAGDVKLAMALGTVLGGPQAIEFVMLSIIFGGFGALALLIKHRRTKIFFSELLKFFRSILTPKLAVQFPKLSRTIRAPFGIALFLSFLTIVMRGQG